MEVSKIITATLLVSGFIVIALALLGEHGSFNDYTPSEQIASLSNQSMTSLNETAQTLNATQQALMSEEGGVSQVVTFVFQGAINGVRTLTTGLKYTTILFTTMLGYAGITGSAYTVLVTILSSVIVVSAVVMLIRILSGGRV